MLIDLVFTNSHHKVVESGLFDLGLSDHSLVYCVLKSGRPRGAPKTIEYRSYKNYNKDSFIEDLENIPWHVVFNNTDNVDDCVNTCLLYTSPSPRDGLLSRMPSSA